MPHDNDIILTHDVDRIDPQGSWIWDTRNAAWENGITCLFRRTFDRTALGATATMRISADSRYRAYLNGTLISRGPCRGTVDHYHYETIDLTPHLVDGRNVLAVEVRWYGRRFEPRAEAHLTPGLWAMIGDNDAPARIVTDESWRVFRSPGHRLISAPTNHPITGWYCVVDPTEVVDLSRVPSRWRDIDLDDSAWSAAISGSPAICRNQPRSWWFVTHELEPREIPPLEETPITPESILRVESIAMNEPIDQATGLVGPTQNTLPTPPVFWSDAATPLVLPGCGTHAITINMGQLVTAYPRLTITAPQHSLVEFRCAEALSHNYKKTLRDDPTGSVEGYHDLFIVGNDEAIIEPFVWRTFRFLRITVHHPAGPATLRRLDTTFTAYPFVQRATFASSDPLHRQLWDVSWQTFRMCAHEHFEDCPYYEQLQYVYDTRLESLVSTLITGDFRLTRQALRQIAQSQRNDGITMSRAPSVAWEPSIIPPLSLLWIEFLDDFFTHSADIDLVRELWPNVERVLGWFDRFNRDGALVDVPYWNFTDWTLPITDRSIAESSADLNMRHIGALRSAIRLATAMHNSSAIDPLQRKLDRAIAAVRKAFWNDAAGLFCDELNGTIVAEHASIHAILYDVVDAATGHRILDRLATRNDLARTSIAYGYDTFSAYTKLSRFDEVWQMRLHNWTDQLALHASTWFETREPSRSDCHGWGSWIMTSLLTQILGIAPAEPGYRRVRIAPNLLSLTHARGSIVTVRGPIIVAFERTADVTRYTITLPNDTPGELILSPTRTIALSPGLNTGTF